MHRDQSSNVLTFGRKITAPTTYVPANYGIHEQAHPGEHLIILIDERYDTGEVIGVETDRTAAIIKAERADLSESRIAVIATIERVITPGACGRRTHFHAGPALTVISQQVEMPDATTRALDDVALSVRDWCLGFATCGILSALGAIATATFA